MSHFQHHTTIVEEGAQIGSDTRIWHFCHIMKGASIGAGCVIGQNVFIASGVLLGDNVKVQNNVSLYTGVRCEEGVFIGPSAVFTNVINPRSFVNRREEFRETLIRKGASIGANATIVCGVEIGAYAMIGAGTVVVKNVPPYALVVGNPARQIGWISEYGQTLVFDEEGFALCVATGQKYQLTNDTVLKLG